MSGRGYGRNRGPTGSPESKKDGSVVVAFGGSHEHESITVQSQLLDLRTRREDIEKQLDELDACVYDLETTYLRQYVELGGCLFDGFGLERQQMWCVATAIASPPGTNVGGAQLGSADEGQITAYRNRLHRFTPNDRIFTASSVGALEAVERVKMLGAAQERAGATKRMRKRARGSEQ